MKKSDVPILNYINYYFCLLYSANINYVEIPATSFSSTATSAMHLASIYWIFLQVKSNPCWVCHLSKSVVSSAPS